MGSYKQCAIGLGVRECTGGPVRENDLQFLCGCCGSRIDSVSKQRNRNGLERVDEMVPSNENIWVCCKIFQNSERMKVESADWALQAVCYRAVDETGKVVMKDWKENSDSLRESQHSVDTGFPDQECLHVFVADREG